MAPGTEFARFFCAGIGPLQLGIVLVCFPFMIKGASLLKKKQTSTFRYLV